MSQIVSSATLSFCLILNLSPGVSSLSPFLHSTAAGLLRAQCSVATPPSFASLLFSSSWKQAGTAEGVNIDRVMAHTFQTPGGAPQAQLLRKPHSSQWKLLRERRFERRAPVGFSPRQSQGHTRHLKRYWKSNAPPSNAKNQRLWNGRRPHIKFQWSLTFWTSQNELEAETQKKYWRLPFATFQVFRWHSGQNKMKCQLNHLLRLNNYIALSFCHVSEHNDRTDRGNQHKNILCFTNNCFLTSIQHVSTNETDTSHERTRQKWNEKGTHC